MKTGFLSVVTETLDRTEELLVKIAINKHIARDTSFIKTEDQDVLACIKINEIRMKTNRELDSIEMELTSIQSKIKSIFNPIYKKINDIEFENPVEKPHKTLFFSKKYEYELRLYNQYIERKDEFVENIIKEIMADAVKAGKVYNDFVDSPKNHYSYYVSKYEKIIEYYGQEIMPYQKTYSRFINDESFINEIIDVYEMKRASNFQNAVNVVFNDRHNYTLQVEAIKQSNAAIRLSEAQHEQALAAQRAIVELEKNNELSSELLKEQRKHNKRS